MNEYSKIDILRGIGAKTAELFRKLGINTVGDLLTYYPRDYDFYGPLIPVHDVKENQVQTVRVVLYGNPELKRAKNLQIISVIGRDTTGGMQFSWFNMPFLKNKLRAGVCYIFRGKVLSKGGRLVIEQGEIFTRESYEEKANTYLPIYGLTANLTSNAIIKAMKQVIESLDFSKEYLPSYLREENSLAEYNFAIQNIHFPKDYESLISARKRLVFDEFFLFILALRKLRESKEETKNSFVMEKVEETETFIKGLPYSLTNSQKKVWGEIERDLSGDKTMSRLIQGDVGSGKTIVAVLALIMTAKNGCQGALMVPTEVLARQHYESILSLFEEHGLPYQAALLTGSMTAKEKREVYELIEKGQVQIIIGTHALIQEKVVYENLALVITDEQHRFGVRQRETFAKKGAEPHVLVMSATPIPRTLAIIIYGDLDISVIDELPAERLPIKNCVIDQKKRSTSLEFIKKEIAKGRQAYIICPMVEESEGMEAENVVEYTEKIRPHFDKEIKITYLHGKMKPREKNEIMESFMKNEIQLLVSTTVVEVGVNVPNASVMMIENAERFGLAQLHQLRGRVGRGKHQSFCILVSASDSEKTKKRLEILNRSNDGFFIASEDLKLRGPGDLFGIRQSGMLEFKIGDIFTDADILKKASEGAAKILQEDEELKQEVHQNLKKKLDWYLKDGIDRIFLLL